MNTSSLHPRWWKGVTLMLIIWALAGVGAFLGQFTMSSETTAQLPPEQQEMWVNMPGWAWLAYAVATLAGLAGAICLWFHKRQAIWLFPISLIAVLVQFSYPFVIADGLRTLGPSALIFPGFIIAMAVLQSGLARSWADKGWLT